MAKKIAVRGQVTELDQRRMTFKLQPIYGHKKVSGPIPKQCYATFLKAFNGDKDASRILIEGVPEDVAARNPQDNLLALKSVERVALLHPRDFHASLDEFRNLQDGWHEGDGKAPPHSGLDWLSHAFRRGYPDDIPLPYTYPTFEGGVQCEWAIGQFRFEIEIDLDSHKAEWLWYDRKANFLEDYEDKILNLEDPGAWAWMANRIRETLERAE